MILREELNEESSFDLALQLVLSHDKRLFNGLAQPEITKDTLEDIQMLKEVVPRLAKRLYSLKQQCWNEYMPKVNKDGRK